MRNAVGPTFQFGDCFLQFRGSLFDFAFQILICSSQFLLRFAQFVVRAFLFFDADDAPDNARGFSLCVINNSVAVPNPKVVAELMANAIFMAAGRELPRHGITKSLEDSPRVVGMNLLGPPTAVFGNFLGSPTQKLRHSR